MKNLNLRIFVTGMLVLALCGAARAEASQVRFARQLGLGYLQFYVMQDKQMVERQAERAGLGKVTTVYSGMGTPTAISDALLSGNVDIVGIGLPAFLTLWDKTRGNMDVRGMMAMNRQPAYLNTRNPNIKSIRDFTDKDRIAVPSVKVSTQALFLQIAAEKEWGPGQHGKLDHLTVGLAHPDAIVAVLNPVGEITAHFATSPFHEAEMKAGLKTVTSGYEIMGGEVSNLVFITTEKFRAANPKVYAVVVAAMDEAIAWTNADKRRAAKLYMDMTKEKKLTEDDVTAIISAPGFDFTKVPKKTFKFAEFLHRIGSLKNKPESWKDLYFAEAYALGGD